MDSLYNSTLSTIVRIFQLSPALEQLLFPAGLSAAATSDSASNTFLSDPFQTLVDCLRLGAPLALIFNALRPNKPLDVPDVAAIVPGSYTNTCKRCVYHFLVAVKDELALPDSALFAVSDLYKDDTEGLVKAIKTVSLVLDEIEKRGLFPPPRPVPFQTSQQSALQSPTDNRARVIAELLQTERTYTHAMQELLSYQQDLLAVKDINKDVIYKIFSNLPELVDFQRRFLLAMEATLALPFAEQRIGALFINHKDAFDVYRQFCGNYNFACQLAIKEAESLKKVPKIDPVRGLQGYLIKPVQRICKYPLLLNELIKLSSQESYPYYNELLEGLEAVKHVTELVNETKRIQDNRVIRQEMIDLVEDWKGIRPDDLGELLLSDRFTMLTNEGEKEYLLFLFERLLLCIKETKKKKKRGTGDDIVYTIKGNIFMTSVSAVEDISHPSDQHFELLVHWRDIADEDTFNLRCRNQEQVSLWKDRMTRLIQANFQRRKSLANARAQEVAGWMNNLSLLGQQQQYYNQPPTYSLPAQPNPKANPSHNHTKSIGDMPDPNVMKRAQSIGASLADIGLLDSKMVARKSSPATARPFERRPTEIAPRSSSITTNNPNMNNPSSGSRPSAQMQRATSGQFAYPPRSPGSSGPPPDFGQFPMPPMPVPGSGPSGYQQYSVSGMPGTRKSTSSSNSQPPSPQGLAPPYGLPRDPASRMNTSPNMPMSAHPMNQRQQQPTRISDPSNYGDPYPSGYGDPYSQHPDGVYGSPNMSAPSDPNRQARMPRSGSIPATRLQTDLRNVAVGGPSSPQSMQQKQLPPAPMHDSMHGHSHSYSNSADYQYASRQQPNAQQQNQYQQLQQATSRHTRSGSSHDVNEDMHAQRQQYSMSTSPPLRGMAYQQPPASAPPRPPPSMGLPPPPSQAVDELQALLDESPSSAYPNTTSTTTNATRSAPLIKIKAYYQSDIILIAVPFRGTTYRDLVTKITRKIRLNNSEVPEGREIQLKYRDEEGDYVVMNGDDDVGMAFEVARGGKDRGLVHIQVL